MDDVKPKLNNEELQELVEKSKTGDPKALGNLCGYMYPKVYRYLYYRINNAQDAEDQTSEVCLKALKNLDGQNGPFYGWIFRIATNTVTDYYRRKGTRVDNRSLDEATNMQNGEHDNLIGRLDQARLRDAILNLTEEQQQVMLLKFIDWYETEEIAQMLGKTTGAVRAIQFRGLSSLRDIFGTKDGQVKEGTD